MVQPGRGAVPAGTALAPEHLEEAEAEWTASESPVFTDMQGLLGRALTRPMAPGQAVRESDLRRHLVNDARVSDEGLEDDGATDPRFSQTPEQLREQGIEVVIHRAQLLGDPLVNAWRGVRCTPGSAGSAEAPVLRR